MRDPIYRYLRSIECPDAVAEEIAQETFLRLHRSLTEGLQVKDVRAWTFRVARNLWIDSRRSQKYYSTDSKQVQNAENPRPAGQPSPEMELLAQERLRRIDEELRRLPDLQRECVYLKAQGLRYREIAMALDISMSTAVECVRRAVKRLSKILRA